MTALALLLAALAAQAAPPPPALPPTIPPATLDDTLEIAGDPLDAKRLESRMAVDVRINGAGPFRFVVDSGADRTVIGSALAARLGLPAGDAVMLHDVAGAVRSETVRIETLTIGTSAISGIAAPALPERFIGAQGLLGIDALAEQRLMLDFEQRRIIVEDARKPVVATAGEIVVTARRRKGQLILTRVQADGGETYAVIDSGAQVTIGNSALKAQILRGRRPPTPVAMQLVSVTGRSFTADAIVLRELKVGSVIMRGVTVAFSDAPPFALFGLATQPAMLLGTDVLAAFRRVGLDFHRRKVRFVLRN